MFAELQRSGTRRWQAALAASLVLHGLLLLMLGHRSTPVSLMPSEVALGTPYSSGSVVYLAPLGPEQSRDSNPQPLVVRVRTAQQPSPARKPIARQREEAAATTPDAPEITAHGGSPWGSRVPGTPLTGPAIMPALPQVFPDPPVSRADLPAGVEGDVIVEVTIDEQGNVTGLKLTQGIGYGIDEKVLAILRQWRFRPATRDGVTVASQHLVHFHYPS